MFMYTIICRTIKAYTYFGNGQMFIYILMIQLHMTMLIFSVQSTYRYSLRFEWALVEGENDFLSKNVCFECHERNGGVIVTLR